MKETIQTFNWYDTKKGSEISIHHGDKVIFIPLECSCAELAKHLRTFIDMLES